MPHWMKKILVALIAVATLGIYTPTNLLEIEAEESKDSLSNETDIKQKEDDAPHRIQEIELPREESTYLTALQNQAREQSLLKFGPRISEQVADEFTEVILPQMEYVLEEILTTDEAKYFHVTENPAGGYGERIFNIVDVRTEEDFARFHVRREHRPLEGHYFNFHYHLSKDRFETHYQLGEIFWDKNTPPKWMA